MGRDWSGGEDEEKGMPLGESGWSLHSVARCDRSLCVRSQSLDAQRDPSGSQVFGIPGGLASQFEKVTEKAGAHRVTTRP